MPNTDPAAKPRVLSGITASGRLHIGNYIGALSVWAREQHRYENYFFIADLHALTIPENVPPSYLREHIREIVALYLAGGLDPDKSVLFRQSQVPAHSTLAWIFDCLTPVSWLERMTQYKAKSQRQVSPSAGLLTYPALQAADILLYQAHYVPVGDDQRQHVELTRDIAQRFNHLYGDLFVVPDPLIPQSGARIMGLDDPTVKMSKSLAEVREGHAIGLLDPPDRIRRTVMRAVTDSSPALQRGSMSPGVDNLLTLYEVLAGETREQALAQFEGKGYGTLKKAVAEISVETVMRIRDRYDDVRADETVIENVLAKGAEKAAAVANHTLHQVMQKVGLD
jgi:tryptophanyl-tRNA synthetase